MRMSLTLSTIEGRYELIARIATGGMGEVFLAHDAVLARDVAVKLLHTQLAGDHGFVDRFRREARAAAILNHPNIVGVYDWGSTGDTYFMVMEFVQGMNLRTLLLQQGRLEPSQVVEVSMQVLAALDHAHHHGIVHRDVKPENILIARDGTVKVADFGLARAYAEAHISQTEGTVTGTVQYLAPEQIQGAPADPRTDLYALGVVMFELLSGQPPFTGETALSIAYQHLSGHVAAPSSIVPEVPRALDQIVLRATARDREERQDSARTIARDLARAAGEIPKAPRLAKLAAQVPATEAESREHAATVTFPRAISPRERRARRLRLIATILGVLALLGLGAWTAWTYAIPHYTHVPRVVGLPEEDASARLRAAGLSVRIGPGQHSTTVGIGVVIDVKPPPGTKLRKGDAVLLTPSLGPVLIPVPNVTGQTEEAATRILKDAGFNVVVVRAFNEFFDKDRVIGQNPQPDTNVEQGTKVTITVSRGPPLVEVPDLSNRSKADAKEILSNLDFKFKVIEEYSLTVAEGDVINTQPAAGTSVQKGSTVTLVISKGPKPVVMPNVVGMTEAQARAKLEGLNLLVDVVTVPYPGEVGVVVLQAPTDGKTIHEGDHVTIYVSQG